MPTVYWKPATVLQSKLWGDKTISTFLERACECSLSAILTRLAHLWLTTRRLILISFNGRRPVPLSQTHISFPYILEIPSTTPSLSPPPRGNSHRG